MTRLFICCVWQIGFAAGVVTLCLASPMTAHHWQLPLSAIALVIACYNAVDARRRP